MVQTLTKKTTILGSSFYLEFAEWELNRLMRRHDGDCVFMALPARAEFVNRAQTASNA